MAEKKSILIVDDEVENLEIYKDALEATDEYTVTTANDGMDAFKKAREQKYSAVITDFRMPRFNGCQLIMALQNNKMNKGIPILVLSGHVDEAKEECAVFGIDKKVTFLSKPMPPSQIQAELTRVFQAAKESAANAGIMDKRIIMSFFRATVSAFSTMGQVENIKPEKPFILKNGQQLGIDISGVISIVSDSFTGTLYLSLPKDTFLKIVSTMFDEKYEEIDDEVSDAVAELSNIVLGNSKHSLNELGYKFKFTLPTILMGHNHTISNSGTFPIMVLPFQSNSGRFFLLLAFDRQIKDVDTTEKVAA